MVIGKFGQQLHAQGELHAARQLFEETLNGRIETLGKRHVDTLKSRNNLAAVLYAAPLEWMYLSLLGCPRARPRLARRATDRRTVDGTTQGRI